MANFSSLKQAIQNNIKENGNKEITGNLLQEILLSMVVTMGDNAINSLTTVVNELNTILHSVDAEPTKNSVNLVRSGGVWSGINREALRAFNAETFEARFNSTNNRVEFFNQSGDMLYWYDASAFVTTGLVEDVYIENDNLVFVINTSAGEKTIEVPLEDVFNPNNYYTKTQIDDIVRTIRELYDGAEYRGFITPSSQAESKQGVKMVCFATEAGTYTNFLANYDTPIVIPVRGIWVFERGVDADDWTAYSLLEIDKVYAPAQASGMGRVVLQKNMVNGVNTLTQDMFYKGEVGSRVPNTNTIFVIEYDFILGEDITVPSNCVLEFDGGSLSNGILTNWKIDVIHYSWFKNINDAIANSVENEAVLDGDFKTVTVTSPIVVNFEKKFFKVKNFNFVWGATKDYTDNPTNYPTRSNPNILSQSILYFSNLIYYSEIVNCSFDGAMFGIAFYWPHNSPNIIDCHFTNIDCCIFCYSGSQNYNIRGCRAESIGCFFSSSATCFENTNPNYQSFNDNYYTDGLCIKDSDNGNNVFYNGIAKNQSFDTWFKNNILKPTTKTYTANNNGKYYGLNTYESWKTGLDSSTISSMLSNNIAAVSENDMNITGHVIYIPFRNRRTVGAIGMEVFFDFRGSTTTNDLIYVGYNIRKGLFRLIIENRQSNGYNYIVSGGNFEDCQIYTCDSTSGSASATKIVGGFGNGTRFSDNSTVVQAMPNSIPGGELIKRTTLTYDPQSIIRLDSVGLNRLNYYEDNKPSDISFAFLTEGKNMLTLSNGLNGSVVRAMQRSLVTEFLFPDVLDENGKVLKTVLLTGSTIQFTKSAVPTDKAIEVKLFQSGALMVPSYINNDNNVERFEYLNGSNNYRLHLRNEFGTTKNVNDVMYARSYKILYIDYRCYCTPLQGTNDYKYVSLYSNKDVIITGKSSHEGYPESFVTTALMNSIYDLTLPGFKCFNTTDNKHYERRTDGWYSEDFGDDTITNKSIGSKKISDNTEFCYNGNSWVHASGTFTEGILLSQGLDVIELFKEDISDVSNSFGTHFIVTMNKRAYGLPKEVDIVSVTCDKYRNQYIIDVKSFEQPPLLKYGYFIDSNNIFHVYLAKNETITSGNYVNNQIFITRFGGKKVNFTFNYRPENISDINFITPKIIKLNKIIQELRNNIIGDYEGQQVFVQNINKPVWWNGTSWVDALGNPVNTVYPKVIGTPIAGNLVKFNSTDTHDIEDAGIAPQS